jgi:hypothetical protein
MWSNKPRSLPDWIEDAYESLVAATAEQNVGIPREQAHEQLLADETFPDEPADAEYAIDRLLDAGWLYAVDDELRITDPER